MTMKRVHPIKKRKKAPKAGTLIIIGGKEDKTGDQVILKEVAKRTDQGKLVVISAASEVAHEIWEQYRSIFRNLGVKKLEHLCIKTAEEARDPFKLARLEGAQTLFFTGGDQLRLSSKIGGTAVKDFIFELYENGGTIAGTSAGASVMGPVMLVGASEPGESHKVGNFMMAPGLGLVDDVIIDQHFAQRGRIGRLLRAVAQNPAILGIGIDEDTSIILQGDRFLVRGSNAVYVVDGSHVSYTNMSESGADRTMSMHDVKLHIMADSEIYNLKARAASIPIEES
jgi:cyanophycinase